MERIIAWLGTPLTEGGALRMWMPVAAGLAVLAVLLVLVLRRIRKKKKPPFWMWKSTWDEPES